MRFFSSHAIFIGFPDTASGGPGKEPPRPVSLPAGQLPAEGVERLGDLRRIQGDAPGSAEPAELVGQVHPVPVASRVAGDRIPAVVERDAAGGGEGVEAGRRQERGVALPPADAEPPERLLRVLDALALAVGVADPCPVGDRRIVAGALGACDPDEVLRRPVGDREQGVERRAFRLRPPDGSLEKSTSGLRFDLAGLKRLDPMVKLWGLQDQLRSMTCTKSSIGPRHVIT